MMRLKKEVLGIVLAGTMLFTVQSASACAVPGDPYDGSWLPEDGFDGDFGVSVYTPVVEGLMFITGRQGSIELAIDQKTYPIFQPIYILEDNSGGNYYASVDQTIGSGDVLLGSQPKVNFSFTVAGESKPYDYYDGGGYYKGLRLLGDDYSHFGLVKITDLDSSPVPIPGAGWLLGSGLIGLAGLRKRKK